MAWRIADGIDENAVLMSMSMDFYGVLCLFAETDGRNMGWLFTFFFAFVFSLSATRRNRYITYSYLFEQIELYFREKNEQHLMVFFFGFDLSIFI